MRLTGAVWILLSWPLQAGLDARAAEIALNQGRYDEAASLARGVLRSEARNSAAHVIMARALIGQNDAAGALRELTAALKSDPGNVDALYYLSKLSTVLAQQQFSRLYAATPDSARVHQLLAESLHQQDDSAGEEREYLAAYQRDPKSVTVLNALGDLLRTQSRSTEAMSYYAQAEKLDPRSFDALYGLGACQLLAENYPLAIEYLTRAAAVDPASSAAQFALAETLLRDKQAERAEKLLRAVVAREPDNKQTWFLLAKALRQLGRKPESDEAFAQYRKLSQSQVETP